MTLIDSAYVPRSLPDEALKAITGSQQDLLDYICKLLDGPQWQPIETAPKDETEILVGAWIADDGASPVWATSISSYVDTGWRRGFRHRNGARWATHWMPIPPPPEPTP